MSVLSWLCVETRSTEFCKTQLLKARFRLIEMAQSSDKRWELEKITLDRLLESGVCDVSK